MKSKKIFSVVLALVMALSMIFATPMATLAQSTNGVQGKYVFTESDGGENYQVVIWDDGDIAIDPSKLTLSATVYVPYSAYLLTKNSDAGIGLDVCVNIASGAKWGDAEGFRNIYDIHFKRVDSAMREDGIDWWHYDDQAGDVTEEKPSYASFEKVGDFIKITYRDASVDESKEIHKGTINVATNDHVEDVVDLSDIPSSNYGLGVIFLLDGWKFNNSGDYYITDVTLKSGQTVFTKDFSVTDAVGELWGIGDEEPVDLYPAAFDPDVHAWNSGEITTAPTCTKEGVKTYTCTVCGETKTDTVAATGHSWDAGKVTKAATTTATGVKTYTCKHCKATKTETIPKLTKKTNPLKVKAKTASVKYSKLKEKAQTFKVSKVITFTKKGEGKITYTKVSGNKKITINKKTGKVTVKKKLKKGTYKVKVKVNAAGNTKYKAATKTVTFKVKVK